MIRQIAYSAEDNISFVDNLNACLNYLESSFNSKHLLGVIFFIDSHSDADYFEKKRNIRTALDQKKWMMPFNVQAQSCKSVVSIEIWIDDSADRIEYLSFKGIRYSRVTSSCGKTIWGIGITSSDEQLPLAGQIDFSFDTVLHILENEGMGLTDIVRQWNYVPGILNIRNQDGKMLQHYQIFNEVRQKYFSTQVFKDGYPAATGIGTRNGNFDLDFFAIQKSPLIHKIGLSNPKQHNAYEYDETLLMGDAISGTTKRTPLFERAKILETNEGVMLFISGTASIIGQETIGIGDVQRQTEVTIGNILELISTRKMLQSETNNHQFTFLRAYIKKEQDFQIVRSVCETSFPGVSISYLQADICRKELLVEIEGEAIFC